MKSDCLADLSRPMAKTLALEIAPKLFALFFFFFYVQAMLTGAPLTSTISYLDFARGSGQRLLVSFSSTFFI